MNCPKCNGDTKVTCCRKNDSTVARARKCKQCGHTFYTVETVTKTAHVVYRSLDKEYINRRYYNE